MVSVIIVDDDQDSVNLMSEFLQIYGITVLGTGYNGKEAYELYLKHNPDVVILDMKMPEFDGNFAIDMIKKEDANAKIIVVTSYTKYPFTENEVFSVFHKPFEVECLIPKINEAASTNASSKPANISQALKNVLLRLGKPQFELVESRLRIERNIQFEVCHNFPSNLKTILKDTFGDSYEEILNQLEIELGNLKNEQKPREFFEIMRTDFKGSPNRY
jgi:two-component system, chemotaxis family, chemotaxis protein CheY